MSEDAKDAYQIACEIREAVKAQGDISVWLDLRPLVAILEPAIDTAVQAERSKWEVRARYLMSELDRLMEDARNPGWWAASEDDVGVYVYDRVDESPESAVLVNTLLDAQIASVQVIVDRLLSPTPPTGEREPTATMIIGGVRFACLVPADGVYNFRYEGGGVWLNGVRCQPEPTDETPGDET